MDERGFFVSLHELTSTYPTLSRRGVTAQRPPRNAFAYILAMFMPGGNVAQGGPVAGMLMVVVVMGLMAAMAIPASRKCVRARRRSCASTTSGCS